MSRMEMRKVDTRDESTMEYALLKNKNKRKLLVSRYLMEPRNVQNSREQLFFSLSSLAANLSFCTC